MIISGYVYPEGSSTRSSATLTREGSYFRLRLDDQTRAELVEVVTVEPPLAGVPSAITLGDGRRFVPHEELPDGFLPARKSTVVSGWLHRLERVSVLKTLILLLCAGVAVVGYYRLVPVVTDYAVQQLPPEVDSRIGEQLLDELDQFLLEESRLTASRQERIRAAAQRLVAAGGSSVEPRIHFRHASEVGPNAFALPGESIVLFDDLVDLLNDDQVQAVIAHEMGHLQGRHGMRKVARVSGIVFLGLMIFGSDEGLFEELVGASSVLAGSAYSRDFERDADRFAAELLAASGGSPADLASALEVLYSQCGDDCLRLPGWLSTHPLLQQRVEALRGN